MVTIRLSRGGSKKRPFYAITVADSRRAPIKKFIERIGFYNPNAKGADEMLRIDLDRVKYWVSVGAQPTERVSALIKQLEKASEKSVEKPVKKAVEEVAA